MRTTLYSLGLVIAVLGSGCMSAAPQDSVGRLSLDLAVEKAEMLGQEEDMVAHEQVLTWTALDNVTSYELRVEREGHVLVNDEVMPRFLACDSGEAVCTYRVQLAAGESVAWVRGRNADYDGEWSEAYNFRTAH